MSIEKKIDVTALGELLIDFTQNGLSEQGNNLFEANPGGAPCNVLAMLNKAGKKTAFIGKVGNDMFGRLLKSKTEGEGIDMSGLEMDDEIHTTLAFVEKLPNGDRDFSFYRNPGADVMLTASGLPDLLRPQPPSSALEQRREGQGKDRVRPYTVRYPQDFRQ